MNLRELLAHNLRQLRRAKGMTQEGLAWEACLTRSQMSGIERGVRAASVDNLETLATALGVEPVVLLQKSQ